MCCTILDWTVLGTWAGVLVSEFVGYLIFSVTKQIRDIYDYLARQTDRKIVEEIWSIHEKIHSMWVYGDDRIEIDKKLDNINFLKSIIISVDN